MFVILPIKVKIEFSIWAIFSERKLLGQTLPFIYPAPQSLLSSSERSKEENVKSPHLNAGNRQGAQLCQVRLREISNLHCNTLLRMKNSRQRLNSIMSTCMSMQTQGKDERLQLSSAQPRYCQLHTSLLIWSITLLLSIQRLICKCFS